MGQLIDREKRYYSTKMEGCDFHTINLGDLTTVKNIKPETNIRLQEKYAIPSNPSIPKIEYPTNGAHAPLTPVIKT
jgi:hypothetical protein